MELLISRKVKRVRKQFGGNMKTWIQIWSMTIFLFLLPMGTQAYTIYDNYYGANAHGYGDVLGESEYFDVSRMDVNFNNGTMIVDIYSRYFNNIGIYGTQLGDLFISTHGWHPYGEAPYLSDNASHGTTWDYVAVLDNHLATSGHFSLYEISDGGNIVLSYGPSGSTWRDGQAVQFAPAPTGSPKFTGTWSIGTSSDTDDYLRFTINYNSWGSGPFGFHWTMSCANDVIEGEDPPIPTPEPATMLLLGSGLIGLSFGLRKKFKK